MWVFKKCRTFMFVKKKKKKSLVITRLKKVKGKLSIAKLKTKKASCYLGL